MLKKLSILSIIISIYVCVCNGAISVNSAWEVRPTVGASTNGGGFVQGAAGTDMSIFNNKNAAACSSCQSSTVNISTTDAVTAGTTTITSVGANFSSAIVGNIVYVTGGTGSITAARYQVVTFTNVSTIVVDRSTGLTAGTGATLNIGGSLDDIKTALLANTAGNIIFVKATGTLTITSSITLNNNQTPSATIPMNQIIGYTTTRTDNGRATIQASTNTGIVMLGGGQAGWVLRNLVLDCNNLGTCSGVGANYYTEGSNLKITNFTVYGYAAGQGGSNGSTVIDSEITGGTSCTAGVFSTSSLSAVLRNYIHDNTCTGVTISDSTLIAFNLIANNTGATTDGVNTGSANSVNIFNNTIYKSGRHGINIVQGTLGIGGNIRNNLLISNGQSGTGYGFVGANVAGWPAQPFYDGNAYFGNATGARNFVDDVGATNPINALHYVNSLDITLTGDPFTNAAGGDFSLNNTAGAGAAVRGTGTPGALLGISQTGAMDLGALQAAVTASGSNSAYIQ